MGERKVLVNYISPDFDPSIIPKHKKFLTKDQKNQLTEIRTMISFSMRCNTCGEYMYAGKKFNCKKEMVKGDDYMGIKKFRFIIKCSFCSAPISYITDPKNSNYEMESGATRNFEVWRSDQDAVEAEEKERYEEEDVDSMKALENRALDSKIEMDVLDALDEMKAINQRHERVDTNALINTLITDQNKGRLLANGLTAADEELVKSIKFKSSSINSSSSSSSSRSNSSSSSSSDHKRKADEALIGGGGGGSGGEAVEEEGDELVSSVAAPTTTTTTTTAGDLLLSQLQRQKEKESVKQSAHIIVKKKKKVEEKKVEVKTETKESLPSSSLGLLGLGLGLMGYASSDDE